MYKNIISLLLFVLLVIGCDSQQADKSATVAEKKLSESTQQVITQPITTQPAIAEEGKVKSEPVAEKVESAAPSKPIEKPVAVNMSGEQVYKSTCQNCHASGAAGSPKLDDMVNWKPRIAKGMDALYQSAIMGVPATAMLPKGTCSKCTDDELRAAVDFMVSKVKNN